MSFQPDGSENVNLSVADGLPGVEDTIEYDLGLWEQARAGIESASPEENAISSKTDLVESRSADLRALLLEAVGSHCDYRCQQGNSMADERRVNRVLNVLGQWLNDKGQEQSIFRDSAGLALAELAEEVRQMIQWPEFLAQEAAREVQDHARAMEWMRL